MGPDPFAPVTVSACGCALRDRCGLGASLSWVESVGATCKQLIANRLERCYITSPDPVEALGAGPATCSPHQDVAHAWIARRGATRLPEQAPKPSADFGDTIFRDLTVAAPAIRWCGAHGLGPRRCAFHTPIALRHVSIGTTTSVLRWTASRTEVQPSNSHWKPTQNLRRRLPKPNRNASGHSQRRELVPERQGSRGGECANEPRFFQR